jgi:hypothetical protein
MGAAVNWRSVSVQTGPQNLLSWKVVTYSSVVLSASQPSNGVWFVSLEQQDGLERPLTATTDQTLVNTMTLCVININQDNVLDQKKKEVSNRHNEGSREREGLTGIFERPVESRDLVAASELNGPHKCCMGAGLSCMAYHPALCHTYHPLYRGES